MDFAFAQPDDHVTATHMPPLEPFPVLGNDDFLDDVEIQANPRDGAPIGNNASLYGDATLDVLNDDGLYLLVPYVPDDYLDLRVVFDEPNEASDDNGLPRMCATATEVASSESLPNPQQPAATRVEGPVPEARRSEARSSLAMAEQAGHPGGREMQQLFVHTERFLHHVAELSKSAATVYDESAWSQIMQKASKKYSQHNNAVASFAVEVLKLVQNRPAQGPVGVTEGKEVPPSSPFEDKMDCDSNENDDDRKPSAKTETNAHGKRSRPIEEPLNHDAHFTPTHGRGLFRILAWLNEGKIGEVTERNHTGVHESGEVPAVGLQRWLNLENVHVPAEGLFAIRMTLPKMCKDGPASGVRRRLEWCRVAGSNEAYDAADSRNRVRLDSLSWEEEDDPAMQSEDKLQQCAEELAGKFYIKHSARKLKILPIIVHGDTIELLEVVPWTSTDFRGGSRPEAQSLSPPDRLHNFSGGKSRFGGGSSKARPESRTAAVKLYEEKGFNIALVFCLLFAKVDEFFLRFVELDGCEHRAAIHLAFAMLKKLQAQTKQAFQIRVEVMRQAPKVDAVWRIFNKLLSQLSNDSAFLRGPDDESGASLSSLVCVTRKKAGKKRRKTQVNLGLEAAQVESRATFERERASPIENSPDERAFQIYLRACEEAVKGLKNRMSLKEAASLAWTTPLNEGEEPERTLADAFLTCLAEGGETTQNEQSDRMLLAAVGRHEMKGADSVFAARAAGQAPEDSNPTIGGCHVEPMLNALLYVLFARGADPQNASDDSRAAILGEIVQVLEGSGIVSNGDKASCFLSSGLQCAAALSMTADENPALVSESKGAVDDRLNWLFRRALSVDMPQEDPPAWRRLLEEVCCLGKARKKLALLMSWAREPVGINPMMMLAEGSVGVPLSPAEAFAERRGWKVEEVPPGRFCGWFSVGRLMKNWARRFHKPSASWLAWEEEKVSRWLLRQALQVEKVKAFFGPMVIQSLLNAIGEPYMTDRMIKAIALAFGSIFVIEYGVPSYWESAKNRNTPSVRVYSFDSPQSGQKELYRVEYAPDLQPDDWVLALTYEGGTLTHLRPVAYTGSQTADKSLQAAAASMSLEEEEEGVAEFKSDESPEMDVQLPMEVVDTKVSGSITGVLELLYQLRYSVACVRSLLNQARTIQLLLKRLENVLQTRLLPMGDEAELMWFAIDPKNDAEADLQDIRRFLEVLQQPLRLLARRIRCEGAGMKELGILQAFDYYGSKVNDWYRRVCSMVGGDRAHSAGPSDVAQCLRDSREDDLRHLVESLVVTNEAETIAGLRDIAEQLCAVLPEDSCLRQEVRERGLLVAAVVPRENEIDLREEFRRKFLWPPAELDAPVSQGDNRPTAAFSFQDLLFSNQAAAQNVSLEQADEELSGRLLLLRKLQAEEVHENVHRFLGFSEICQKSMKVGYRLMFQDAPLGLLSAFQDWYRKNDVPRAGSEKFLPGILVSILVDVARGIEYLHANGIIHRDVHLENVYLDGGLRAKLGNFVLAKEIVPGQTKQSKTGKLGESCYTAPEMLVGGTGSARASYSYSVDCYAFGALIHVVSMAFFGEEPHREEMAIGTVGLPGKMACLQAVRDRCMAVDDHKRYGKGTWQPRDLLSTAVEEAGRHLREDPKEDAQAALFQKRLCKALSRFVESGECRESVALRELKEQ